MSIQKGTESPNTNGSKTSNITVIGKSKMSEKTTVLLLNSDLDYAITCKKGGTPTQGVPPIPYYIKILFHI